MKRVPLTLLMVLACLAALAQGDFAGFAPAKNHTQARLLLSAESAKPGDTIWAGVELTMDPQWHTYWRNPGTGIAPTAAWTLPAGITAGDLQWPVPHKDVLKIGQDAIVTYVYEGQVVLLVPITIASNAAPGPASLHAALAWLECEAAGQCVQGKAQVQAGLVVGNESKPSSDAAEIEHWRDRLPKADVAVQATAHWDSAAPGDTRSIIFDWATADLPADFFPFENQANEIQGVTDMLPAANGHARWRKAVTKGEKPWMEQVSGLLVGKSDSTNATGIPVTLAVLAPAPSGGNATPPNSASLVLTLLFAFIGGLILNVMPCVLPVIALKVLGFVNQSKEAPERVRKLGLVYGAGVLVSFLALGGLAVAAQTTGQVAGWGDAIRMPSVQLALTILMTLIALNLFGLFEITLGAKVMSSAGGLAAKKGYGGAFFNGVLATVLATPCTAPYLGAAFASVVGQSAGVTELVFLTIGLGLAFPFMLVCWNPRLLKIFPKPGAWMEKFKMAMGFPMLATAVWLAWVASRTSDDMMRLELFLVVLALAAWMWGVFVQRGERGRGWAAAICLLLVAGDFLVVMPRTSSKRIDWQVWSPDAVEQARKEGHVVLVDFTAKSCLTCKFNKAASIEVDQTRSKLKQMDAVAFEADYTDENPAIKKVLDQFNSPGVPLVLIYPSDLSKPPEVLPTFLPSPGVVLQALDHAAE